MPVLVIIKSMYYQNSLGAWKNTFNTEFFFSMVNFHVTTFGHLNDFPVSIPFWAFSKHDMNLKHTGYEAEQFKTREYT